MADRGRDLKIGILSDVSKFDLDKPARDLEDLGKAATGTGRDMDTMDRALSDTAREAKETATKVDTAFDKIAKASRQSSTAVKTEGKESEHALQGISDEAKGSAMEVAASFDGSGSSILGGFQEFASQAGEALGPVGLAAGLAAAAGVGLITAQQDKLRQMTQDLVQDMIDAGGTLTDEAIQARITTMATEDISNFQKYNEEAAKYGVNLDDITRARAGDVDAIARVKDRLDDLDAARQANVKIQQGGQAVTIKTMADLRSELDVTSGAYEQAQSAASQANGATAAAVEGSAKRSKDAWAGLRNDLGKPIHAKVDISGPSKAQLDAIRRGIVSGIGPVLIKPKVLPYSPFRGMQ